MEVTLLERIWALAEGFRVSGDIVRAVHTFLSVENTSGKFSEKEIVDSHLRAVECLLFHPNSAPKLFHLALDILNSPALAGVKVTDIFFKTAIYLVSLKMRISSIGSAPSLLQLSPQFRIKRVITARKPYQYWKLRRTSRSKGWAKVIKLSSYLHSFNLTNIKLFH